MVNQRKGLWPSVPRHPSPLSGEGKRRAQADKAKIKGKHTSRKPCKPGEPYQPKPAKGRAKAVCPHCGSWENVDENGIWRCDECKSFFAVDFFGRQPKVDAVLQRDGESCGFATTLWLLRKFGALDVSQKKLREELNTDASCGIRAWWNRTGAKFAERLGLNWTLSKGTLPKAIHDALSRRGFTLKNPLRAESPLEYGDYLEDTFNAGGLAVVLIFGTNGFMHWLGLERTGVGRYRLMDPLEGYCPFKKQIEYYREEYAAKYFLVFGVVRKHGLPLAKKAGAAKRQNARAESLPPKAQ